MPPGHVVKLGLLSKGSEKTGRATGPQLSKARTAADKRAKSKLPRVMRYRAVYKAELPPLAGSSTQGKCVARFSRCLGLEAERQCRKRFGSAPSNSLVERGCEIRVTRPKVTPSKEPPSPELS
jgi:hypothetical protein